MKVASQEREVDHLVILSTKPFLARIYPSRLFTNLFLSNSLRSQFKDEKHNFMQEKCKVTKQYKASKQCKAIN